MRLKKVWMSPETSQKSHYAPRIWGGILGIVAIMLLLICGGTVLSFYFHWPREIFSVALCLGVTILVVWLALRLGQRSTQDTTIFFLTEDDRLYIMSVQVASDHGYNMLGYIAGTIDTQNFLRQMAESPFLPARADEILKVERIKENHFDYAIRCQVRHPNRRVAARTCFLVKGYEEEDLLLYQLERRESWENALEPAENRNPLYIFISTLVFAGFATLCIMSHPVLAKLPQDLYFPCLAAAFAAVCSLAYFIVRQRRGE